MQVQDPGIRVNMAIADLKMLAIATAQPLPLTDALAARLTRWRRAVRAGGAESVVIAAGTAIWITYYMDTASQSRTVTRRMLKEFT